jgi:hypothetical protein
LCRSIFGWERRKSDRDQPNQQPTLYVAGALFPVVTEWIWLVLYRINLVNAETGRPVGVCFPLHIPARKDPLG